MKYILTLAGLFLSLFSQGQSYLSIGADYAKVFAHTNNVYYEAPPFSLGMSLALDVNTNPESISYLDRNLPLVGVELYYLDYRESGLGKVIGLVPRASFQKKWTPKLTTDIRVGLGIAYATKHYDRNPWSDTVYNALGSHWNNMTDITLNLTYQFDEHSRLNIGGGLMHVSSSATSAPNYGINNFKFGVRYGYVLNPDYKYGKKQQHNALSQNRHALSLGYGLSTDKSYIGATFPVYIFQYNYQMVQPDRSAFWYIGAELENNYKTEKILQWRAIDTVRSSFMDNSAIYLTLGREWFMGDFGLRLGGAIGYSFAADEFTHLLKPTLIYYPYNIDYGDQNIWKNMYLGLGLTSFTFNAQYMEFSLGTFF